MVNGTTSLSSLPTNPATGNPNSNPVVNNIASPQQQGSPPQQRPHPLSQQRGPPPQQRGPPPQQNMHHGSPPRQQVPGSTPINNINNNMMEKLNNDISNAKNTKLPPRDVPMNTQRITQDVTARPNIIKRPTFKKEEKPKEDFVKNYETAATLKEKNKKKEEKKDNIDYLYEELQAPILIGFMFFILQLPIVRKKLLTVFPFLFLKDGNMNMSGFVVLSMTFAILYYGIQKLLQQFSTIKI